MAVHFHVLSDGKRVREITEEEYFEILQKFIERPKMRIIGVPLEAHKRPIIHTLPAKMVGYITKNTVVLAHGHNCVSLSVEQLKQILKLHEKVMKNKT
ncbi:MAG: hypothetical protein QXO00_02585 [Candidatus Bathyarchaeia archaeon]